MIENRCGYQRRCERKYVSASKSNCFEGARGRSMALVNEDSLFHGDPRRREGLYAVARATA